MQQNGRVGEFKTGRISFRILRVKIGLGEIKAVYSIQTIRGTLTALVFHTHTHTQKSHMMTYCELCPLLHNFITLYRHANLLGYQGLAWWYTVPADAIRYGYGIRVKSNTPAPRVDIDVAADRCAGGGLGGEWVRVHTWVCATTGVCIRSTTANTDYNSGILSSFNLLL